MSRKLELARSSVLQLSSNSQSVNWNTDSKTQDEPSRGLSGALSEWSFFSNDKVVRACTAASIAVFCLLLILVGSQALHRPAALRLAKNSTTALEETRSKLESPRKRRERNLTEAFIPANARFVCVFHGSNTPDNFGTRNFPYAYCHHLVYCCVGVESSSSDGDVLKNVSALSNNQCTVGVIFGVLCGKADAPGFFEFPTQSDGVCQKCPRALVLTDHKTAGSAEKDDTALNMLLSDPWWSAQFAARLLGLHSSAPFSSAYLYWKQPSPSNKNHLTRLAVTLRKKLASHSVDLGLVIDSAGDANSSFNFRGLLKVLGAGLLTAPPFYPPAKLSHPYHGDEALQWHESFASLVGPAGNKVCHTISVAATALHSAAENTLVSFGTLCRRGYITDDAVLSRDKWATLARSASGDVISYLHPDRARSYVAAVHKRSRSTCLGFWNPEFDDYAGICGGPLYPVIRAVVGNPVE